MPVYQYRSCRDIIDTCIYIYKNKIMGSRFLVRENQLWSSSAWELVLWTLRGFPELGDD